jgi:hypothetical protein
VTMADETKKKIDWAQPEQSSGVPRNQKISWAYKNKELLKSLEWTKMRAFFRLNSLRVVRDVMIVLIILMMATIFYTGIKYVEFVGAVKAGQMCAERTSQYYRDGAVDVTVTKAMIEQEGFLSDLPAGWSVLTCEYIVDEKWERRSFWVKQ